MYIILFLNFIFISNFVYLILFFHFISTCIRSYSWFYFQICQRR